MNIYQMILNNYKYICSSRKTDEEKIQEIKKASNFVYVDSNRRYAGGMFLVYCGHDPCFPGSTTFNGICLLFNQVIDVTKDCSLPSDFDYIEQIKKDRYYIEGDTKRFKNDCLNVIEQHVAKWKQPIISFDCTLTNITTLGKYQIKENNDLFITV